MTPSSLIVRFPNTENIYVMKFDKDITISDLCCEIRAKIREANVGNPSAYGIFVTDPDPKHSFWLDNSRMLSYYHLRDNFEVEYRCKLRLLVIQTMDGTKKTLQVDDSKTIAELMDTICSKMGITNHEEYSLIRPMDEEERMRTLTLRKAKSTAKDQDKLEKMKQKLHTDDELNWLSHGKTLRQHDVDESEILLLRRKFFFSDQNVDARDPVQLNLLYIQLKEAILNGTHPISLEQAIQLAALQCQSEIGVLTAEKAKHNPVDLKEHLPKEYWKVKGVEKRIQEAHRNLGNFDERESKLRYVQLCRSLPTYGITFFLIKEKLKGRNKLVPRLFGVSKESVMRVDEKTKEILETWPLTRIRRWAAGPNLFTLDFGQYNPDGNYAMQTTEGEQIGQLISGYIDIILRRQRGKQATMTDGDEENTIVEENVAPSRANVISNVSGTLPRGHRAEEAHVAHSGTLRTANYRGGFSEGHLATRGQTVVQQNLGGAQVGYGRIINRNGFTSASDPNVGDQRQGFQMIDLGQPKRALLSRIDFGLRTIQEAAEELETPIYSDDEALHGEDATTRRWRSEALEQARTGVWSHLGAMTMATGQLVSCIQSPLAGQAPEEFDYTSMDASLASIGMNVHGLMQCVRLYDQIDAASEGGGLGATLKQAAQVLSDAFLALIRATVPAVDLSAAEESGDRASSLTRSSSSLAEPQRNGPDRTTLLEAAGQVGDASRQLLQLISQPGVHSMNARVEYGSLPDHGSFSDMGLYPQVVDWEARDKLLSATKSVANQMAKLVKTAKQGAMDVGQEAFDLSTKNPSEVFPDAIAILRAAQARLVQAATTAGRSASRLVTCAKVVVCTMEQPESQDQLIRSAKEVGAAANSVSEATDDMIRMSVDISGSDTHLHELHLQLGDDLHEGVLAVHSGLDELVDCLRATSIQAHQDPVVSTLLSVASQLPASVGDGLNVVGKASTLVSAASSLLADLRAEATAERSFTGLSSSEANRRADVLEAEIRQLLATAQECASGNVQSLEHQQRVIQAAQRLMAAVHSTTAPILRARLTQGLEFATRLTASNVGPLVTVGGEVVRVCQGSAYKLESNLEHLQKRVMPQVNSSCSYARMEPYNTQKQTDLLVASQNLMQCLEEMLRITDAVVPTIPDAGIQIAFSGAARNTQACLTDLRQCYHTSEMVLSSEPPKFDPDTPRQSLQQQDDPIWLSVVFKTNQAMDTLAAELHSNTTRLLPDETLDSICVALWTAVSAYNRVFASSKQSAFSEPVDRRSMPLSLPPLVTRIVGDETSESAVGSSTRDWNHIGAVLNELLERLLPVFHGIRGLSAFLTASANAQSLDSNLARVLLISHGLSAYRQSSISGQSTPIERRSTAGPLFGHHDEQPQATAQDMLQHLLSIGESCLTDTGQLVAWALQQGDMEPRDEETSQAVVLAEQLTTSVNAVLGYVPGEVIIKRLFALLEDASRMLSDRNTSDQITVSRATNGLGRQPLKTSSDSPQPQGLDKNFAQDMYTKLADCAQRLAKVCLDASYELSEHTPRASSVRFNDDLKCFGNDSEVVRMAHMADRITSRLVELIQAAGDGAVTAGGVNSDHLLVGLTRTGYPVAWAFRHAMRSINTAGGQSAGVDSEQPFQEVPLLQAILQLREWAVELSLQTEAKASNLESSCSELDQVEWTRLQDAEQSGAFLHMRNHCEAAIRRVNTLLRPISHSQEQSVTDSDTARSVSPAVCAIRVPVCQHTYPECLGTMHQLNEDIRTYTDSIPSAAANGDADSFVAAVKSIAQTTCQLLQLTNQAAYLVGAAHPASKPGHVSRLIGPDQLIALHDHIAAVRKGASELTREECLSPTPDGLPSLEVMNIATHMAQRATRLCQSTRPLLSDCKNSAEKKMLAESLERVARATAHVFRSTQTVSTSPADTAALYDHLRSGAAQLEEAVDQYADVLFRAVGGAPTQLAEEAFTLQTPILDSGQVIVKSSSQLLESSHSLITTSDRTVALENFARSRLNLCDSITQLTHTLLQLLPGVHACENILTVIPNLLSDVDNAALNITAGKATPGGLANNRIEASLGLIRSCLNQIEQHSLEAVENFRQGRWELMAHNIYDINSYLPCLIKESAQVAIGLSRASEQAGLLNLARTVLEAVQQLVSCLNTHIQQPLPHSGTVSSTPLLTDCPGQLHQACHELLNRVDSMAKLQGGLSWHITSISAACAKLDDVSSCVDTYEAKQQADSNTVSSLPASFVQYHTRLGHQSRALLEAAVRLTQVNAAQDTDTDSTSVTNAVAALANLFVQMADTVHAIAGVLRQQIRADTGSALAHRLCPITQAVGAACSDFIRSPLHTDSFKLLTNRMDDLKAVLQSCARGADACATAATNVGRLVADLDTAALFARAGTSADRSPSVTNTVSRRFSTSASLVSKQRAFQTAQETAMHAAKGIVEDMRTLIKNTSTDQDALAVSAQNCLLRATDLTDAVKDAVSRADNVPLLPEASTDSCIESQVQLLTSTRDVATGLVQLLNHGKTVAATSYALEAWGDVQSESGSLTSLLTSRQKALNDTAVIVVENISGLSRALRALSDQLNLHKPPSSPNPPSSLQPSVPPPTVPPKRISLVGIQPSPKPAEHVEASVEKTNVQTGLQSLLTVVEQFEKRLACWSIKNGSLHRPSEDCDFTSEEENALGKTTEPQELVTAANAITQAAIKANSATNSGKLSEIAMAGHLLRRATEDLLHILPSTCHSALQSAVRDGRSPVDSSDRVETDTDDGIDSATDDEAECSLARVERACRRALAGSASTISELRQLVMHMITSLDTGPSSPASVQVTLAMRRLRETVYEIVENAKSMPGGKVGSMEQVCTSAEETPAISTKPFAIVLRNSTRPSSNAVPPQTQPKPLMRNSSLLTSPKHQAEVEESIAAANATASDTKAFPLQKELTDVTGELEQKVYQIGQLHSKRALVNRKSVRFASSSVNDENKLPHPVTPSSSLLSSRPECETDTPSIVDSSEGLDAVISACQHVVHTTLSLMYWAAAAQRELVQQGRLKPVELDAQTGAESESQWAQGLISAARYVAAAANYVVESARAMVAVRVSALDRRSADLDTPMRNPKPEALISAAQTTAACTAQLVVACVAKADPSSKSCIGLRQAGAGVKRATDHLVRIVQSFSSGNDNRVSNADAPGHSFDGLNMSVVSSMRQVIETKSSIAAKQKELETLHSQLKQIHQDQYKPHTS